MSVDLHPIQESAEINDLVKALCNLQATVEPWVKDASGLHYKYAKLDGLLEIIKAQLQPNGLVISQHVTNDTAGRVGVTTKVMHTSGQWQASTLFADILPTNKGTNALQALGGAITYLRKYTLAAILGIAQVDDDGATQEERKPIQKIPAPERIRLEDLKDIEEVIEETNADVSKILSYYQVDKLESLTAAQGDHLWSKLCDKRRILDSQYDVPNTGGC